MTPAEILVALVAAAAVLKGGTVLVQGILRATKQRPITLRRIGSNKSVTVPVKYNEKAVKELLELIA